MNIAHWTITDENRSIEYETFLHYDVLHYDVDEDKILIGDIEFIFVTDWSYDKNRGVAVKFLDEEQIVRKWIMEQIRDGEPYHESAVAACRKDYEEHLETLCEKRKRFSGKN